MKCKNRELWNIQTARLNADGHMLTNDTPEAERKNYGAVLDALLGQKNLSGKTYAGIIRMTRSISSELEVIDKARVKLVEKFAEGEGKDRKIPDAKLEEFGKEFNELLDQETEMNVSKIDVSEVKLPSASHFVILEPFVKE